MLPWYSCHTQKLGWSKLTLTIFLTKWSGKTHKLKPATKRFLSVINWKSISVFYYCLHIVMSTVSTRWLHFRSLTSLVCLAWRNVILFFVRNHALISHKQLKSPYCTREVKCLISRKLCYRKDDRAMRPTLWVPWKFSGLPDYVHGHYSQYFIGFCSGRPYECSYKIWSP